MYEEAIMRAELVLLPRNEDLDRILWLMSEQVEILVACFPSFLSNTWFPISSARFPLPPLPTYIFIKRNLQTCSHQVPIMITLGSLITPIKLLLHTKPYRAGCLLHRRAYPTMELKRLITRSCIHQLLSFFFSLPLFFQRPESIPH